MSRPSGSTGDVAWVPPSRRRSRTPRPRDAPGVSSANGTAQWRSRSATTVASVVPPPSGSSELDSSRARGKVGQAARRQARLAKLAASLEPALGFVRRRRVSELTRKTYSDLVFKFHASASAAGMPTATLGQLDAYLDTFLTD
eukprot:1815906-Heterocapsa_arctica.AAC.1